MKTKNILFITHTYTTFQKSQIESVAKEFDKVYVLVRYKPIAEISRFLPIRYLRTHSKNSSIDLNSKPDNVHVFRVPIFYFPWKRSYLKLGDRLLKKIKRIIKNKSLSFDLIHAHYFWTSGYIAVKLKEAYQKPVVITNHSTLQLTEYPHRNQIWKDKITETITGTDKIFVVNDLMREKVKEIDTASNVEVIPIGFNDELFYPVEQEDARRALALPEGVPIILNISRLDDNKNLELFINGSSMLINDFPNMQCIIIGEGRNFSKLRNLINELGVEGNIRLLGLVPHHEITQWINACDCVVLTSYSEGSPTVMYEALACGKPFLGSNVGGIPDIVNDSAYGYIFNPHQIKDFTSKFELVLKKKWDQKEILLYGSQFSQTKISSRIIDAYNALVNP